MTHRIAISWQATVLYAALALLSWLGRTGGAHVDLLTSDAAANAASIAVRLWPDRFTGDLMLQNRGLTSFYTTALTPYLIWAGPKLGGLANAYIALLAPTVFTHLVGFHLLGRYFLDNESWAAGFSLANLLFVSVGPEYWGLYIDPLTRTIYQAFFPWLLIPFLLAPARLLGRAAAMIGSGLLIYISPHNAVTQAFAILCGFVAAKPTDVNWRRHLWSHFGLGVLFLAFAVPFALHFTNATTAAVQSSQENQRLVVEIAAIRMPKFKLASSTILQMLSDALPFIVATAAGIWFFWFRRPELRVYLLFVAGWLGGLTLVAIVVPIADGAVAAKLQRLPVQFDFLRSLRYLVPVGWLFMFMLAAAFVRSQQRPTGVCFLALALVVIGTGYAMTRVVRAPYNYAGVARMILYSVRPDLRPSREPDARALIARISRLPPSSRILAESQEHGLAIRHEAFQPVVYTHKEGGWFLYGRNYPVIIEWFRRYNAYQAVHALKSGRVIKDEPTWWAALNAVATDFGAQYLALDRDASAISSIPRKDILLSTPTASLVRLPSADKGP